MRKRKIAVMVGSKSDFPQCRWGIPYLVDMHDQGKVELFTRDNPIVEASIHRHTDKVLHEYLPLFIQEGVGVLIAGAGGANHLTGTVDAYLRNALHDGRIVVVGVAFEDEKNARHTQTAIGSITDVPGTQVVFDNFVGENGFFRACKFAAEGELPRIMLGVSRRPAKAWDYYEFLAEFLEKPEIEP